MGIFVLNNYYTLNWDNSTNAYEATFTVSGVIINEGPRSVKLTN